MFWEVCDKVYALLHCDRFASCCVGVVFDEGDM